MQMTSVEALLDRAKVALAKSPLGKRRAVRKPEAKTILIVDDEAPLLDLLAKVLKSAGYEIATAESGAEAIDVHAGLPKCDLLLTDLKMPHMSGQELAILLHRFDPGLKVLYLTGFVDGLFEARSLLWPQEAFVEKPVSASGICEAVALALVGNPHMIQMPTADHQKAPLRTVAVSQRRVT